MAEAPARSGPSSIGASAAAIYTAGGASTWAIMRSFVVTNSDTVPRWFTLGIHTSAADSQPKRIANRIQLQPNQQYIWEGFLPLLGHASTPDILYGLAEVADQITISIGLLTGP